MKTFIQTFFLVLFTVCSLLALDSNPIAKCKSSIVKSLDEQTGVLMLQNSDIDDGSIDYVSSSLDRLNFGCEDLGKHIVTLTVIDAAGKRDSCTCELEVVKDFGPTAICIPDSTLTIDWHSWHTPNINRRLIDGGSYDFCSGLKIDILHNINFCQRDSFSIVQLTVVDIAGNISTCESTIKVIPFRDPNKSLICADSAVLYVYPGIEKELLSQQIVKTNPLGCNNRLDFSFVDEFGENYNDWKFNFEDIGKNILATVTIPDNSEFCQSRIVLDSCPYYRYCDTFCRDITNQTCEDGLFGQLKWPCDITLTDCLEAQEYFDPYTLNSKFGYLFNDVYPELNALECQVVHFYFVDTIEVGTTEKIVHRTWNVIHVDINESRTYTQKITIPFVPLEICDFLPYGSPVGDCALGHSLEDMVEWPEDFETRLIDISPQTLLYYFWGGDTLQYRAKPKFYNVCIIPEIEFNDEFSQFNDSTFITKRKWTVIDHINNSTYDYVQTITQILYRKAEICLSNVLGERLTGFDLERLKTPVLDTIFYNENGCIEVGLEMNIGEEYSLFADSLGIPKSMDGINIVDMVAIRDHILELEIFDNSLSEIAAKFSGSGITTNAITRMLRAIIGIPGDIQSAKWLMADSTKSYPPYDDYEGLSVFRVTVKLDNIAEDLIVFKAGDVNFSGIKGENTDGEFKISIQDEIINMGELYQIQFIVSSDTELRAFQLEFNEFNSDLNQINWVSPTINIPIHSSPENSAFPEKHIITSSYTAYEPITRKPGDTLVTLEFRALKNGVLSEMLSLYPSENNLAVMPVGQLPKKIVIDWKDRIINNNVQEIELEKISLFPNPTSEYLEIKGITATINYQITDMLGKVCSAGIVSEDARLNVEGLNNGIYILTMINAAGARKSFKVFVSR